MIAEDHVRIILVHYTDEILKERRIRVIVDIKEPYDVTLRLLYPYVPGTTETVLVLLDHDSGTRKVHGQTLYDLDGIVICLGIDNEQNLEITICLGCYRSYTTLQMLGTVVDRNCNCDGHIQ